MAICGPFKGSEHHFRNIVPVQPGAEHLARVGNALKLIGCRTRADTPLQANVRPLWPCLARRTQPRIDDRRQVGPAPAHTAYASRPSPTVRYCDWQSFTLPTIRHRLLMMLGELVKTRNVRPCAFLATALVRRSSRTRVKDRGNCYSCSLVSCNFPSLQYGSVLVNSVTCEPHPALCP